MPSEAVQQGETQPLGLPAGRGLSQQLCSQEHPCAPAPAEVRASPASLRGRGEKMVLHSSLTPQQMGGVTSQCPF